MMHPLAEIFPSNCITAIVYVSLTLSELKNLEQLLFHCSVKIAALHCGVGLSEKSKLLLDLV